MHIVFICVCVHVCKCSFMYVSVYVYVCMYVFVSMYVVAYIATFWFFLAKYITEQGEDWNIRGRTESFAEDQRSR